MYALLTNWRFVVRLRTIVTSLVLLSAGVLQYGFVLLRSGQPDAYVESRVTTVRELFEVMRGAQFADRLFVFEWRAVLFERIPLLVGQVLVPELTIAGLVLALAGAVLLSRRRPATAVLLLTGGSIIFGFVLNYSIIDSQVFLIPTFLALWLCAAVAMDDVVTRARHSASALG